ncbi:hypothetical protein AYO47_06140 [Planctomyces sp. SCGC AG-212-M04]|nr:hypothetical protein AYO47_06140 [Planctomyces sp. SCGC AG-212-M04]
MRATANPSSCDKRPTLDDRVGLSLIDLVVSVLIMGIFSAVAVPKFTTALCRTRAESAARRIAADLRFARNNAIASSASSRIDFSSTQGSHTLVGQKSIDRPTADYQVSVTDLYQSTLSQVDFGGDASLVFDMHGQPDSAGSIAVSCGGVTKTIVLNSATGSATIL